MRSIFLWIRDVWLEPVLTACSGDPKNEKTPENLERGKTSLRGVCLRAKAFDGLKDRQGGDGAC
jgi:hypothetical protein